MYTHTKSLNRFYPIPGFPGYYINKTTTEVLCTNEPLPVILDTCINSYKDPYKVVTLMDGKNHFIHRLMAKTFLPGPEKEHVNHIDGNKNNNSISNLEWATPKENAQHAVDTGLTTHEHCTKEVHQYTLKGIYLTSYPSDISAEEATGVAKQNISKTTLGHRLHAGGYQWRRLKLPAIAPVNITLLKGANVMDTRTGETTLVLLRGQNFFGPVSEFVGSTKKVLIDRFEESEVIFWQHYRIEKVYFD